jgi:hypothetical protein
MRVHNSIPLTDFMIDLEGEDSSNLEVIFEGLEDQPINTRYKFFSEVEIDDNNSFLRSLNHGRGFYTRNFQKNKKNHKIRNNIEWSAKEEFQKRKNRKKINYHKELNDSKQKKRRLATYWEVDTEEIQCRVDNEKNVNVYHLTTFTPKDIQGFINSIEECVEIIDKNTYPIVVINDYNEGGLVSLSQLFMGVLSPLMPINLYKGRFRITEGFQPTEELMDYIESNFTDIYTCNKANYTNLIKGSVEVNYTNTKLTEEFYINNASIYNKIEELRLKMENKRKPTEILVLTDGYTFSAAALYIKYLQKMGGAIVAGYYGYPYKLDVFDSSQSPSAVFSSELLNIFNPEERYKLYNNLSIEMQIPGIQTFFDFNDKNIPLEYEVTPIDHRIDIFSDFCEDYYYDFIDEALIILNKYNETHCNSENKRIILLSEECDGHFLNQYTHGGFECGDEGLWSDKCVEVYCSRGYNFDRTEKKCIKDICSSYQG